MTRFSLALFSLFICSAAFAAKPYAIDDNFSAADHLKAPPAMGEKTLPAEIASHENAMKLRNEPIGKDAVFTSEYKNIPEYLGIAAGIKISKKETPRIYKLLSRAGKTVRTVGKNTKNIFPRVRPYVLLNETTCKPEHEEGARKSGSYPSMHSAVGMIEALALAKVIPEFKDAILERGKKIGEHRVICGYHWDSDVEAGFALGQAVAEEMFKNPKFRRNLHAAQKEYRSIKKRERKDN